MAKSDWLITGQSRIRRFRSTGLCARVVTFNNGRKLKEVVDYMPLDRIVLETDCPYLSPVPNRGKRNSSLNLPYVAEAIGQIKGISPEEVIAITNQNARNLYRL